MGANVKLAESMGVAGRTMADMNRIMKPEQIAATVNAFTKENMKMEMTDEMSESRLFSRILFVTWYCFLVNDTLDDMLTESGDEEESDNIVS